MVSYGHALTPPALSPNRYDDDRNGMIDLNEFRALVVDLPSILGRPRSASLDDPSALGEDVWGIDELPHNMMSAPFNPRLTIPAAFRVSGDDFDVPAGMREGDDESFQTGGSFSRKRGHDWRGPMAA